MTTAPPYPGVAHSQCQRSACGQHAGMERDIVRGSRLCDQGFEALRFWDSDVLKNPEGVVRAIAAELERRGCHPTRDTRAHAR